MTPLPDHFGRDGQDIPRAESRTLHKKWQR
jgi:hypothetical protein